MPPTLLQRGKVRHANYAIPSTLTAVEYIVSTVQKRIQMPATWDSRVLVVKAMTGSGTDLKGDLSCVYGYDGRVLRSRYMATPP
jgi:hypothetical protein